MPCYKRKQALSDLRVDGKCDVRFSKHKFHESVLPDNLIMLPCGQCIGCRLDKSRDWGLRCVHEAKMHDSNCFITLTFDEDHLFKKCPSGSVCQKHISDFVKRLRRKIAYFKLAGSVHYFGCGEYGPTLGRPHYHLCLFGFEFPDRKYWRTRNGFSYYTSEMLSSLWPFGYSVLGDVTFESAAYVARYCVKKITGEPAKLHYSGRTPEFSSMSLKPAVGRSWFEKYAETDVIPHDCCILDGAKCRLPRYYSDLWKEKDPVSFAKAKLLRRERAQKLALDNTEARLAVKLKCQEARMKNLYRCLEV